MPPNANILDQTASTFYVRLNAKIADMQQNGQEVIRLDIGSPDLPPHPDVIETLYRSAQSPDRHGYQPHRGARSLREAWAGFYKSRFEVDLDPEKEILSLVGSKEGIFHLMPAEIDPGDVVLLPDPGYPTYAHGVLFAGGEPYTLPLRPENHFLPDLEAVPADIAARARAVWLNYPNNPTGAAASLEFFTRVVEFARKYQILVCHDAAYTQVTFDGIKAPSIFNVPGAKQVAVEFNSVSKSHNMAGWRVGILAGNSEVLDKFLAFKANYNSSHFLPVMDAAAQALQIEQNWIEERNLRYQKRRDMVFNKLRQIGFQPALPQGGLYIWCPLPHGWQGEDFAEALLDETQVSVVPGSVFGSGGEGYFRLSLVRPTAVLSQAMARLEVFSQQKELFKG